MLNKESKEIKKRDEKNIVYTEDEKKTLEEVSDITGVDYVTDMKVGDLINALSDMVVEYNNKNEELEDLEEDVNENYTRKEIDYYDYYGVSRNDFC